jgi:hypothetical protein
VSPAHQHRRSLTRLKNSGGGVAQVESGPFRVLRCYGAAVEITNAVSIHSLRSRASPKSTRYFNFMSGAARCSFGWDL